MKFKQGVSIRGLREEMHFALGQIDAAANSMTPTYVPTCTSGVDGKHSPTSLHYDGRAVDIRTRDLPPESVDEFEWRIRAHLSDDYDVVLERDHIHVEWQPKRPS